MSAADILDFLRPQFARVNERLDGLSADMAALTVDMADLTARTGRLELLVAALRGDFAGQSLRLDNIETRLDRVEHRIEGLANATPMSELVYWFNRGRCPDCHGAKIMGGPRPEGVSNRDLRRLRPSLPCRET